MYLLSTLWPLVWHVEIRPQNEGRFRADPKRFAKTSVSRSKTQLWFQHSLTYFDVCGSLHGKSAIIQFRHDVKEETSKLSLVSRCACFMVTNTSVTKAFPWQFVTYLSITVCHAQPGDGAGQGNLFVARQTWHSLAFHLPIQGFVAQFEVHYRCIF